MSAVLLLLVVSPGRANAGPPGPSAPTSSAGTAAALQPGRFDDTELRRGANAPSRAGDGTGKSGTADGATSGYELPRVVLALGAVVGLILLLRWAARRFFALPSAQRSSQVVQVLSRSILSPKQQLLLVKVGRRVLVAADNGSQLSALSEITDPDEVASLVGQLRSEKDAGAPGGSPVKAFNTLFGRLKKGYEPDDAVEGAVEHDAGGHARQDNGNDSDSRPSMEEEEETGEGDDDEEREEPDYAITRAGADVYMPPGRQRGSAASREVEQRENADPNVVAATRQELTGLLEKIRLVSDQFARGPKRDER